MRLNIFGQGNPTWGETSDDTVSYTVSWSCENDLVLKKLHFMMNKLYLTYGSTDSRRLISTLVMEMLVPTPQYEATHQGLSPTITVEQAAPDILPEFH